VDGNLREIPEMNGWVSPRLGVRFNLSGPELKLFGPDGQPFLTYQELAIQVDLLRLRLQIERMKAQLRALGIEPEV
jgi:hypothetical protein